ncbi:hypothetical protein KAR91_83115 [Candidatus Pacearchaeota archaeon]|nr:hypothetical protein [Candidatus Pacearchaeota archaeon]
MKKRKDYRPNYIYTKGIPTKNILIARGMSLGSVLLLVYYGLIFVEWVT